MTKKKSLKTALIMAIISVFACLSMFVGTTFAWFTDSVTSSGNIIKAGNLDIEMYWATGTEDPNADNTAWNDASKIAIFNYDNWEPGYVDVKHVKISNEGSLAFQYVMNIKANGEVSKLAEVIDVYVVDPATKMNGRADLVDENKVGTLAGMLSGDVAPIRGDLNAKESDSVTIALKMQDEAGNEYQNLSIGTDFSVQVLATQLAYENDSFGSDYDAGAPWIGTIDTAWYFADTTATSYTIDSAEELAGLASIVNGTAQDPATGASTISDSTSAVKDSFKGKTVNLGGNIDLNDMAWTPIGNGSNGFCGTFNGQGYTIYNLNVSGKTSIGLFGYALNGGNIKNLTVENAIVIAEDYAGAILGRGYTDVVNCHAVNVKVTVNPYWLADKNVYDGGAKAGAIVGQLLEGAGNTVVDCTVKDVVITGYRDLGGVLGMAHNNNTVSGCSAQNVTINYVSVDGVYDDGVTPNQNAGAIVGRIQSSAIVDFTAEENAEFALVLPPWDKVTLESPELVDGVYNVSKPSELAWLASRTEKVLNISLTADIDMLGATISSIDLNSYHTVNGNGYTISNAVVEGTGLFGSIKADGTIKNITLDNITVNNASGDYAGIVNGQYSGKYEYVTVLNSVVNAPNSEYVGGLAGAAYKNIINCSVENISVTGTEKVGGLIGFFTLSDVGYSIILEKCSAKNVTVTATNEDKSYAGVFFGRGLATSSYKFVFDNCSATMKDGQVLIGQDYNKNIDISAINVTTIQ